MSAHLLLAQKPFIELQIEALVEENCIKRKRVDKFIDEFNTRISEIEELDYDELLDKKFRLPLIGRPNAYAGDYPRGFKFIPPKKISILGGYTTSTAIKGKTYIDLAICMPSKHLEKKDVKNQRYHRKRALYMAQLATLLNGSTGLGLIESIEYQYFRGNFLKPTLLLTPMDAKLKEYAKFQVFVYPDPTDCPIRSSILVPNHGNVAPKWFFENYPIENSDLTDFLNSDSDITPSPFYNSDILSDLEMIANSDMITENVADHKSITEALMLTKIWLLQRDLHYHFSFIISMFVAYLQTKRIVHHNMSSYQIFKTIIKSLTESDWTSEGLSYYDDSKYKIQSFKPHFGVIFLGPSGTLNLCYHITRDLYERLKHEALVAHELLTQNIQEAFDLLFLKKLEFFNKFDAIVHLPQCTKRLPSNLESLKKFMDHGILTPHVCSDQILGVVQRALTDRVTLIQQSSEHLLCKEKRWNLKGIPYDPSKENITFVFGLLLDAEKSLRIIDVGPPADSQEAEEFREFWGPKSQLRLQNGIISETVVWHVDSFSQRRAIIKYILTHALKKLNLNQIVLHYTLLEQSISLSNVLFAWRDEQNTANQATENGKRKRDSADDEKLGFKPIGVGEEVFQKALQSYNELNQVLRGIENMKHSITSIQPVSHHIRASAPFPPMPVSLQAKNKSLKRSKGVTLFPEGFDQAGKILHIEPISILVTLEGSGKWPNEIEALEAAKQAYLIQLAESLKEKSYSIRLATENYLDILHGQFIFRLRVRCPKELALSSQAQAKPEFQRRRLEFEIEPRIHASLDQLYREKIAFGTTCRLVKRWLACQLLSDHLNDLTIDLLVAHLFLNPEPYTEPSSSSVGFRRFLELVAKFDWSQLPLIVNLDDQMKEDEITRVRDSMLEDRRKFPPLVVCTPYDKGISPWTRENPSQESLDLLVMICTKAHQYFNKEILLKFDAKDEFKALFRPNFKIFQLLIKLNSRVVQNFFMSFDPPKNFQLKGREPSVKNPSAFQVMPIVGLNIVDRYVNLLKFTYNDVASFFHDRYGQRVIGITLKPDSELKLHGDISKFIRDVKQLGSKMVDSIVVLKQDR